MFTKLFKQAKQKVQQINAPVYTVEQIHEEFDTATDKILAEANEILANKADTQKGDRLKKIGFTQSKEVIRTLEQVKKQEQSEKIAAYIQEYSLHYPNQKFITEEVVERICKKYGLLCSGSSNYIGDVPEKNLKEIEAFELKEEHMIKNLCGWYDLTSSWPKAAIEGKGSYGYHSFLPNIFGGYSFNYVADTSKRIVFEKPDFKICAPVKDFNTENMRIEDGYKLCNIPDPIVLQPVSGGYLIVTKWGAEGEDEELVNEKMN